VGKCYLPDDQWPILVVIMKKLTVLLMIAVVSGAIISIAFAESWKFAVTDDSRAVAADNNT
jgi:hypothetical protein